MDPLTFLAILLFLGPGAASFVLGFRFGQTGFGIGLFMLILGLILYHYRRAVIYNMFVLHPIVWMNVTLVIVFLGTLFIKGMKE
jgi:hypothetical protein